MTNLEPHVPKQIQDMLDKFAGAFVGVIIEQKQQIYIRPGRELMTTIPPDRHDGDFFCKAPVLGIKNLRGMGA